MYFDVWMKSSLTSSLQIQNLWTISFLYFNKWLLLPFSFNILPGLRSEGVLKYLLGEDNLVSIVHYSNEEREDDDDQILNVNWFLTFDLRVFAVLPVVVVVMAIYLSVLIGAPYRRTEYLSHRDDWVEISQTCWLFVIGPTQWSVLELVPCYLSHLTADKGRCNVISLTEH